jgi:hypothetical protein
VSRLCAAGGLGCGQSGGTLRVTGIDLGKHNPPGVQEKKSARFWPAAAPKLSTKKYTGRIGMPVENLCGQGVGGGFPQIPNGSGRLCASKTNSPSGRHGGARRSVAGTREQAARLEERAARQIPAGYHSPVCSNTGDAIDRITAAIDQLASDARDAEAGASGDELTARVATLWQMVSDLDPELARRARRYTGPADGGPSA